MKDQKKTTSYTEIFSQIYSSTQLEPQTQLTYHEHTMLPLSVSPIETAGKRRYPSDDTKFYLATLNGSSLFVCGCQGGRKPVNGVGADAVTLGDNTYDKSGTNRIDPGRRKSI